MKYSTKYDDKYGLYYVHIGNRPLAISETTKILNEQADKLAELEKENRKLIVARDEKSEAIRKLIMQYSK
jgi:hypothetical protein